MTSVTLALIAPLALLLASPPGQTTPSCVDAFIRGEEAVEPALPAPTISPATGSAGTPVTITGGGLTPGANVTVIGLYGEGDCGIRGLGDQRLGITRADDEGRFELAVPWPALFEPLLGREDVGRVELPDGRYYIIAFKCSDAGSCATAAASAAGGPFVLEDAAAPDLPRVDPTPAASGDDTARSRGPAVIIAGASVLVAGSLLLRRMVRAR